jgi:hypothetical protein
MKDKVRYFLQLGVLLVFLFMLAIPGILSTGVMPKIVSGIACVICIAVAWKRKPRADFKTVFLYEGIAVVVWLGNLMSLLLP